MDRIWQILNYPLIILVQKRCWLSVWEDHSLCIALDLELSGGEGARVIPILVPEPVSLPQVEELLAQDAGKGGAWLVSPVKLMSRATIYTLAPTHDAAHHGLLCHAAGEEVDIVDMLVHVLQPRHRPPIHHVL